MSNSANAARLRKLRADSEKITYSSLDSGGFAGWKAGVRAALQASFGTPNAYLEQFDQIWWTPAVTYADTPESQYQSTFETGLSEARAILDSAIDDIGHREHSGLPPAALPFAESNAESFDPIGVFRIHRWPRWLQITVVCVFFGLMAAFGIWASLPDETKTHFLSTFNSSSQSAEPCTPPTAETLAPDNIGPRIAYVHGRGTGTTTNTWFDFDSSQQLRYSLAALEGNGTAHTLQPNTIYYYRYVAQNPCGTTRGEIRSFKTPSE